MQKLHRVEGHSLAWASAGNKDIGYHYFKKRIEVYQWDSPDWETFAKDAADALAGFNGDQRRRSEVAGVQFTESKEAQLLTDVMLAGWLRGVPEILVLGSDGNKEHTFNGGFYAVGSWAPYAIAAFNTAILGGLGRGEAALRLVMEGAVEFAPNCFPPATGWRITEKDVYKVFTFRPEPASQSETDSNAT